MFSGITGPSANDEITGGSLRPFAATGHFRSWRHDGTEVTGSLKFRWATTRQFYVALMADGEYQRQFGADGTDKFDWRKDTAEFDTVEFLPIESEYDLHLRDPFLKMLLQVLPSSHEPDTIREILLNDRLIMQEIYHRHEIAHFTGDARQRFEVHAQLRSDPGETGICIAELVVDYAPADDMRLHLPRALSMNYYRTSFAHIRPKEVSRSFEITINQIQEIESTEALAAPVLPRVSRLSDWRMAREGKPLYYEVGAGQWPRRGTEAFARLYPEEFEPGGFKPLMLLVLIIALAPALVALRCWLRCGR